LLREGVERLKRTGREMRSCVRACAATRRLRDRQRKEGNGEESDQDEGEKGVLRAASAGAGSAECVAGSGDSRRATAVRQAAARPPRAGRYFSTTAADSSQHKKKVRRALNAPPTTSLSQTSGVSDGFVHCVFFCGSARATTEARRR